MRPQLQSVTLVNPRVLKDVQRYERRLYPTALSVRLFHDQGVLYFLIRLFSLHYGADFQPLLDRKDYIFEEEKRGQQGEKRQQRTPCWNLKTKATTEGGGIQELLEHLSIVSFSVLKYFWSGLHTTNLREEVSNIEPLF